MSELLKEKLPQDNKNSEDTYEQGFKGEIFPGGDLASRSEPESISNEKKKELTALSMATEPEKLAAYGKALGELTPEQRTEWHAFQRQSLENVRVAEMTPESRRNYFAPEKRREAVDVATQEALDTAEPQDAKSALYSLKLLEPTQFKERYNQLPVAKQVAFDAFEAKEDAAVKVANPELTVAKLSVDGETWVIPPERNVRPLGKAELSEADLRALSDKANSLESADRKEYVEAVKSMPVEELIALSNHRREEGKPLNENYLKTMYLNGKSGDPRLFEDFKKQALEWTPAQQKQYMEYAQMRSRQSEPQKPQGIMGRVKNWFSRKKK